MILTTLLRLAISPHFAEYRVEILWTQFGAAPVRTSPGRTILESNQAAPLKRESQANRVTKGLIVLNGNNSWNRR